jgi:hypothetical protein
MKVAFGLKAHSGWAALVVLANEDGDYEIVDRRRLELVNKTEESWAKQPYHAAEELNPSEARKLVSMGLKAARENATREMRAAVLRAKHLGYQITGCGVLMGQPMPEWSVDEILAVHFRMHKAEGVLFRDALARAATKCGLRVVEVPEKELEPYAEKMLKAPWNALTNRLVALGKSVGPPWGKDQKDAALAAMIASRTK